MKNILLIGGEGYVGNVLCQNLMQNNYSVISIDNLLYDNHQCVINKCYFNNYKFVFGDMCDDRLLKPLIDSSDIVILLAGLVGDPITKNFPKESHKINDEGVMKVIKICADSDIERFIFISTCSNYGLIKGNELADENHELNPLSLYAESKVKAEKYILSLKDKTDMNPTILRFATAFGLSPRMRFDLTISNFTRDLFLNNELIVYDANTWRPYCHVKDFARLIKTVIEAPLSKTSFEVFNVGGDSNNATKQMIVDKILNRVPNGRVVYQENGNDARNYRVSFEKIKSYFGFNPKYSIDDGINELIDSIQNHVFDNIEKSQNFYGNYSINYPVSL